MFFRRKIQHPIVRLDLSNPKPGHTAGWSGWGGARWDGGAGRERAGGDTDGSVRPGNIRPSYPPDDRRQPSWARPWKHEQKKPYLIRWRNKTSGLQPVSAVYPQDDERSSFLVADQCIVAWLFCKPFSCKACPGTRGHCRPEPLPPGLLLGTRVQIPNLKKTRVSKPTRLEKSSV